MSKYLELLAGMETAKQECGLGKVLQNEGQDKHDEVLEAIFAINPDTGDTYSIRKLEIIFREEYGWGEYFFRRHRRGMCHSCLNRTQTN